MNQTTTTTSNRCSQQHVHEVTGIVAPVTECRECHVHRFCTVTDEAIAVSGNDHIHEIKFRTDTADGHYHTFCGKTGRSYNVGNGKHVHYLKDITEEADGHRHKFQVATLIESPTEFERKS